MTLIVWNYALKHPLTGNVHVSRHAPNAFLGASWGMSPEEVASVNNAPLEKPAPGRQFFEIPAGQEDRYKTLETRKHRFLKKPAVVSYSFRDNQLFAYHVFISSNDAESLDQDMRAYLLHQFGPNVSSVDEEEGSLKLIWQDRHQTINYWLYEEDLSLSDKFKAAFGATFTEK